EYRPIQSSGTKGVADADAEIADRCVRYSKSGSGGISVKRHRGASNGHRRSIPERSRNQRATAFIKLMSERLFRDREHTGGLWPPRASSSWRSRLGDRRCRESVAGSVPPM